jgi:hypothetical protein
MMKTSRTKSVKYQEAPLDDKSQHFGKPFPSTVDAIPKFLIQAIEYVEEFGSQTKGIFSERPDPDQFNNALAEVSTFASKC